ncbi:MAG: hypothetical protein FVQ83_16240 [Chloroflexi bacterium]|nr:hypothetical protein [Chloroflexota bacterium]
MQDKEHQVWAQKILVYLINHIKNFSGGDKFITYGELAKSLGYPEPHRGNLFSANIGETLGLMGHMFDEVVIEGKEVPFLQALIVNQSYKIPSNGFKEFYPDYPNLSTKKKRDLAQIEYERIFQFGSRWEKLLKILGIENNEGVNLEDNDKKLGGIILMVVKDLLNIELLEIILQKTQQLLEFKKIS